ncbi:glyoxalase [Sphingomonas sp.]|uniref:glyoxalase n=1 Tax=Sphingomonas sp. TaxID=28214 RepID=UPI003D6C9755
MSAEYQILALRPFVPARDFDLSKRFYTAMGFTINHADAEVAIFESGRFGFILQNFYVRELADNFMLQLLVTDVDSWWRNIGPEHFVAEFGTSQPTAPVLQSWGMKVGFLTDPTGVLWHIAEAPR